MANNKLPTGRLEEPVFVRGFDPMHAPKWREQRPFIWARHVELGRQHPGQWMLVSEIRKGGCKERHRRIRSDRQNIWGHLTRRFPMERWQLQVVTVAGTWCDRELYMRYLGEWESEEVRDADIARRKEEWRVRMEKGRQKKARKAEEARRKAEEETAAAQVRIRARRKPGG